ncbi:flagellar basal-body rod modification protein FlgD [Anaerovirgula multivorans]|uniref:Flagellar basal-body rod modification protein FlgD n=1 Tax=Anaerovirgula multivorans TaxID=312168 RepID=A0A239A3R8_9FIRM|nr:flagellar hook capping FlgD N-terminal domain-containing protein [Anaerovirgula multivorans]SNR89758.1 flagellar basal-body rod modification protein FlgD [Anaerovirgula multivorans]
MSDVNGTTNVEHKYRYYDEQQKNTKSNDLDKDVFMKLLIAQMQNQDPLNPMDDREFIAQMAQFNALEQMTKMNDNLEATKVTLSDHFTMMNNNMVKSQTFISGTLDKVNDTLIKLAEHFGIEIPETPENETEEGEETP